MAMQFGGWYNNPAAGGANQRYWNNWGWTTGSDPTGGKGDISAQAIAALKGSSNSSSNQSAPAVYNQPTIDPYEAIKRATELQKEANAPAVASYQAQIPEVSQKYAQTASQLQGNQTSLDAKYKDLLDSINTQKTQDVNTQTRITGNELGKRGILGSSTLAQQEIQNATSPVNQNYTNLANQALTSQSASTKANQDLIANLAPNEAADIRAINNAIASLQSGAGQSGATLGANLYSSQMQNQIAQQQMTNTASQNAILNALAQQKLNADSQAGKYQTLGEGQTLYDLIAGKSIYTAPKQYSPASQLNNDWS